MVKKERKPSRIGTRGDSHTIENRQRGVRLELRPLERFLQCLAGEIGLDASATFVRFVTDAEMAKLNHTFRRKAGTTDVLSFPAEERPLPASLRRRVKEVRGAFLGDIAISPTVARRNAKDLGRSTIDEIRILILHGVLHLLGYDHDTDRGEMERVESRLRHRLRLA